MFFGVSTLQTIHVWLSLVGIAAGVAVIAGLLTARRSAPLTFVFLAATLLTNLTGFLFPITVFTPALSVGAIGTVVMVVCLYALYARGASGAWRGVYVVTAVISLYLNMFVLIAQLFLKVPALNALAPTGSEPPFLVAQLVNLAIFILAGWRAFVGARAPPAA